MRYLVAAVLISLVVARIVYYVRAGLGKVRPGGPGFLAPPAKR
jgi:hypothetical protein